MLVEGLKSFTDIQWTLLGLMIFMVVFVTLVVSILGRSDYMQKMSKQPLFDGQSGEDTP